MLETTKDEMELASSQIGKLKKELELQQAYYENQLKEAGVLNIDAAAAQAHVNE